MHDVKIFKRKYICTKGNIKVIEIMFISLTIRKIDPFRYYAVNIYTNSTWYLATTE